MRGKAKDISKIKKIKWNPRGSAIQRHWDSVQPGLLVQVYPSPGDKRQTGRMAFHVRYSVPMIEKEKQEWKEKRRKEGKPVTPEKKFKQIFKKLGDWGPGFSVEQARSQAAEIRGKVKVGLKPEATNDVTMDALFTLIEREELYPFHIQSEGYRNRTRYVFDKYIHFKNLPVREITEDHWLELIDSYINEEKFGTAKNLRTFAGMFYKNAQSNPAYRKLRNPLAGFQIHLPKPKTKKSLTPKQLASVSFDSPLHHAVLQMLIYTGQRAMEILPMRWDRINDEYWIVGEKGEMKAKSSAHYLPMTQTIKDIIEPMKEFGSEWVFPGKDTYLKRNSFLQYLQMHYPGYTMHQFRHTFATLATDKAGIDPYGVQLVLHHTFSDVTHQSYMHGQQLDKKREALEEWARYVENIRVS